MPGLLVDVSNPSCSCANQIHSQTLSNVPRVWAWVGGQNRIKGTEHSLSLYSVYIHFCSPTSLDMLKTCFTSRSVLFEIIAIKPSLVTVHRNVAKVIEDLNCKVYFISTLLNLKPEAL